MNLRFSLLLALSWLASADSVLAQEAFGQSGVCSFLDVPQRIEDLDRRIGAVRSELESRRRDADDGRRLVEAFEESSVFECLPLGPDERRTCADARYTRIHQAVMRTVGESGSALARRDAESLSEWYERALAAAKFEWHAADQRLTAPAFQYDAMLRHSEDLAMLAYQCTFRQAQRNLGFAQ